ncbi:MAG: aminodeoxychorismate/anthranilate synthase component II [Deltaproteobacteria bacterium]|nr:aminodeoxychorismate/anthranilate synthase component II [Deltaproteobacteria bacterium]
MVAALRARPAVLVIDNYDSFTFNLVQLLASLVREAGRGADEVVVLRNDALEPSAILSLAPGALVLSPGPGLPRDAGVCLELVREAPDALPIFGVCLGMQILAEARGAKLMRAGMILHGRTSVLRHEHVGCLERVPSGARVMRYHSWAVDPATLPTDLQPTAWAEDGTLMAMRERGRPREAVQFHPESFLTEHGRAMLSALVAQGIARS